MTQHENMNRKTGKLSKLGKHRANIASKDGYDCYTIAAVLDVPIDVLVEFLNG